MDHEDIIYQQHCESYRHQNALKWGRFKTLSVIEGALLYAAYGMEISDDALRVGIFCIFASLLVAIVSLLSLRDRADAQMFLEAKKAYQRKDTQGLKAPQCHTWLDGHYLLCRALLLLNGLNVLVLIDKWCPVLRG